MTDDRPRYGETRKNRRKQNAISPDSGVLALSVFVVERMLNFCGREYLLQ